MIQKIRRLLGFEKLHPDIQFFLDSANLSIAQSCSFIVMLIETGTFINTFFYNINDNIENSYKWLLYHRLLYVFLFLSATQLFIYSIYHKHKKKTFSRFLLNFCILFFIAALLIFGICISINDYIMHEQILVFITIGLFVACLFMIKPYLAIPLIVIPFGIFYYLMHSTIGVSSATKVNYIIIMILFIIVNAIHYQQYLKIAKNNVVNHALAEQLRLASLYDFLTRLKNRNALNMDFEDLSDRKNHTSYIVMLTDLDDFKFYNDAHGHNFGDELLKKFAAILQTTFGKDYCYRYGGDEYLVVLPEIKEEEFLQKIKECEKKINNEFKFSGGYVKGLITCENDLNLLINQADQNLYKAKQAGKNKVTGSFAQA